MANKNKSQKNRRQRKNKTLRGGGMFDWLTGSSSANTAPTAKSTSWFGNLFSSAPKQPSAVVGPAAPLPASAVSEPKSTTELQKPSEETAHPVPTEPKLGGKRKNKSNKNKNRKNKH